MKLTKKELKEFRDSIIFMYIVGFAILIYGLITKT